MRILIVSQYFYPENFRVNDLVEWLVAKGHEVTVLTGVPNYPGGRIFKGYKRFGVSCETWSGAKVIRVPLVPRGKGGGLRLALNYLSFAMFASLFGPRRIRHPIDAIFVHEPSPITVGIPAIVMAKRSGAPIFFWVLDLWPESVTAAGGVRARWLLAGLARMTQWIYSHCEKILVQSRAFIPRIQAMGVRSHSIAYFPNWAEDMYRPRVAGSIPFRLPAGFRIMYAGNIGAAQDFPAILAAAELLRAERDIHWLFLGEGREAPWVRAEIARRGLEATVHMLGSHAPERMPDFFANADVMLVSLKSSPVFGLTVPAKVQAYLACGRPIIAMIDGEGARIVEESGAGWSCAAGDAVALAANVMRMARLDRVVREGMGERGRSYYLANFEREKLFRELEDWMNESSATAGLTANSSSARS